MTGKISVNSQARLAEAITRLNTMFRDKKYAVVSLRPGKDHILDQNALWFALYQRVAKMTQINTRTASWLISLRAVWCSPICWARWRHEPD